jgi:hypothetical protein
MMPLELCKMYHHGHFSTSEELKRLIHAGKIRFAGNKRLKIVGMLNCGSGKRMKKSNRVFFSSEQEAFSAGYRPCGNCMRK